MDLYVVRHGKAEAGRDDWARRLSQRGRDDVLRVASHLSKRGVHPQHIEHSGLVRAQETAELMASQVGGTLIVVPDLLPDADPRTSVRRLTARNVDAVMLVGHLPYMERLASLLLTGETSAASITFATGSVALFEGGGGSWTLEWLLRPALV